MHGCRNIANVTLWIDINIVDAERNALGIITWRFDDKVIAMVRQFLSRERERHLVICCGRASSIIAALGIEFVRVERRHQTHDKVGKRFRTHASIPETHSDAIRGNRVDAREDKILSLSVRGNIEANVIVLPIGIIVGMAKVLVVLQKRIVAVGGVGRVVDIRPAAR